MYSITLLYHNFFMFNIVSLRGKYSLGAQAALETLLANFLSVAVAFLSIRQAENQTREQGVGCHGLPFNGCCARPESRVP
jgi:hypothetical protein